MAGSVRYGLDTQCDHVLGVQNCPTQFIAHVYLESPDQRLSPVVQVAGFTLFMDTLGIAAFALDNLRGAVSSPRSDAGPIGSALDYALHV